LGDGGEELSGFGFVCGGAALVMIEVAQGGLGVGLRAVQEVALTGRGGLSPVGSQITCGFSSGIGFWQGVYGHPEATRRLP
jgi:hypothetical protein